MEGEHEKRRDSQLGHEFPAFKPTDCVRRADGGGSNRPGRSACLNCFRGLHTRRIAATGFQRLPAETRRLTCYLPEKKGRPERSALYFSTPRLF